MEAIQAFKSEFKRGGKRYSVLLTMPFFMGVRLCWRVVYQAEDGSTITKEYRTGRVKRGEELVIDG